MVEQSTSELLVLGAGVIGLSCAWRAAQQGRRVTVLDPAPASGASWVAGGMLAPVTEAWPGEEELLALGVESRRPLARVRRRAHRGRRPAGRTAHGRHDRRRHRLRRPRRAGRSRRAPRPVWGGRSSG